MIQASSGFPLQRCGIKCSPTLTGMFVVFLNVDDLHLLGVLVLEGHSLFDNSSAFKGLPI